MNARRVPPTPEDRAIFVRRFERLIGECGDRDAVVPLVHATADYIEMPGRVRVDQPDALFRLNSRRVV